MVELLLVSKLVPGAVAVSTGPSSDVPLPRAEATAVVLTGNDAGLGKAAVTVCNGASAGVPVGKLGRALVAVCKGPSADAPVGKLGRDVPVGRLGKDAVLGKLGRDAPVGRLGKDELPGKLGRPLEPGLVTETVPPRLRLLAPLELDVVDSVSGPLVVVSEPLELEPPVSGSSALPAVSSTVLTGAGADGVLIVVPAAETVTELFAAVTVKGRLTVPPF